MTDFNINEFGPCDCPIRNRQGVIMPHWRSLVESKYLSHFELQGKDVVVVIDGVRLSEVIGSGGKKSKKAEVRFRGKQKTAVMGVSCLKSIASIYGDDTDGWIGKPITLYPTTTEASGETVGTIRVRNVAPALPKAAARTQAPATPAPVEESEDDRNRRLAAPADDEMGGAQ